MSLIVAIEGPSDSGKSTLIEGLARHFAATEPMVFPCYVEEAGGESKVPPFATKVEEQIRAIDFFLGLEANRHRRLAAAGETVELAILDRSACTLLAHSYAVERLHGVKVYDRCREKVTTGTEVIIPLIVLYLDAGVEERKRRAEPGDRDKWFTNNRFNDEIRAFFLKRFRGCDAAPELHVLNANQPAAAVLEDAAETISSNLR
jgi:thymidylate kinase